MPAPQVELTEQQVELTEQQVELTEQQVELASKHLRDACADRSGPTSDTVAEITRLLESGANVNMPNRNGKCAVHFTAQLRSDTDVLTLLLDAKADVNQATHRGHTPLIYAAGRKRLNVIDFLCASITRHTLSTLKQHNTRQRVRVHRPA